jgi:hypothetical protein
LNLLEYLRMRVCCLRPSDQFPAISWRGQVTIWYDDDDDVRFELDQHALLDFYSASSLKQLSTGRHVSALLHIIPIPSQPVFFFLLNAACLTEKQRIPISYSLVWPDRGSKPRSTELEVSTLTITPSLCGFPPWYLPPSCYFLFI